jgi:Skp family chaperone for outer membrane proteins
MKSITGLLAVCLMSGLMLTGCDKLPGGAGPGTLIVDLAAVAKATGQEESMQSRAQTAREEINARLVETAGNLEQRIEQERESYGDTRTVEQQQQLQQTMTQAQQQYGQLQTEAQQQLQQLEVNMVVEFRELIKPEAEKIARSRNAQLIMLADQSVFWLDPAIDITGDVIGALRAEGIFADAGATAAPKMPAAVPEMPAVVPEMPAVAPDE